MGGSPPDRDRSTNRSQKDPDSMSFSLAPVLDDLAQHPLLGMLGPHIQHEPIQPNEAVGSGAFSWQTANK